MASTVRLPSPDHVRAVLDAVDEVPVGRVTTYGRIAAVVWERTGRGSPRTVGQVLARHGMDCDWFRVLHADGRLPPDATAARAALAAEAIPVVDGRVRPLARYVWPDQEAKPAGDCARHSGNTWPPAGDLRA